MPINENDFYVAIQGIMTKAKIAGVDIDKVHEMATDAADEWLGEEETAEILDEDED